MGIRIGTNVASLSIQRNLQKNQVDENNSFEKISSGNALSTNDRPADVGLSSTLKAEERSLNQAARNANDGISYVQVAEGGLNEVQNLLVRLRELSIQSSTDVMNDKEREVINKEYQGLKVQIDKISNSTEFNGTNLLNSSQTLSFQVGTKNNEDNQIQLNLKEYHTSTSKLGLSSIDALSASSARSALESIDSAILQVSSSRSSLGSAQESLQSQVNVLSQTRDSVREANSKVSDTDMAEESMNLVKSQILTQAGVAVLAQANSSSQSALKLV